MPLETATYISDLVASNPASSDGLNQADDHMRLIKAVVKNTFPNLTGPVTATQGYINSLMTGVSQLAATGAFFRVNDYIYSPGVGRTNFINDNGSGTQKSVLELVGQSGSLPLAWVRGNLTVDNTVTALSLSGAGIAPIGSIVIWPSDTLPPSNEGVWAWCNGQQVSRTTYATAFSRISTLYGAGDGSTTFNLPNYQEVALVGKSTMGGASSPGLLNSISSGLKGVLNGLFGANQKTLTATNLPPYTPQGTIVSTDSGHTHQAYQPTQTRNDGTSTASFFAFATQQNTTTGYANITSTFTGTPAPGQNSTPFDTVQPSRATNYIIRLA